MKLKHIYITKEGEPMGNPEMKYPNEPIEDDDGELILNDSCPNCHTEYDAIDAEYQICHLCKFDSSHEAELQRYHSGLLPFEDRERVERLLPKDAFEFFPSTGNPFGGGYRLKPDTIIPVDIEVEVVEKMGPRVKINHATEGAIQRKVLRIKN